MSRYFLEVKYKGTAYKGLQKQPNALTIQGEIEKAFNIFLGCIINLSPSSRTDAGVHALQNYFHFDTGALLDPKILYNINAILPQDIVLLNLFLVDDNCHSRFDAQSRVYRYFIYRQKNPFLNEVAYYYPFNLDLQHLQEAASVIKEFTDFTTFSKRNTDVFSFNCNIIESFWTEEKECVVYQVEANRFLRGMVRALVATMLKVGRGVLSLEDFKTIIESHNCQSADFSAPAHGLFLMNVKYSFLQS